MDPCLPLVKTSSVSSALTVAHLIRNIEQLKNKDKLISQLEKDLGRQSWGAAAHFAVLERRRSEGNPLPPGGLDPSPPFRTLPEGSDDPDTFLWTPTSIQTPGDVEDAWTNHMEGISLGKRDLPNQLKGIKDRNKELVEKCRSFLQQNKELTAQNRAFQESTDRAAQDAKNMQELLEHSKIQMLQMSREMSQLKAEKNEWDQQRRNVEGLRQERMEDKKMINALRKACSDKDRRIELIQHRKKRRRMLETAEKVKIQNAGLKETPFGYEEDDRHQGDGNQSVCSLSSTVSDDSVWDDVLTKEEMERNYQRLMLEHLELQKSHAMLQRQTDNLQDPQRENLSKTDLQNDLFLSQCRIEQLEYFINERLQGQQEGIVEERERMLAQNKSLTLKIKKLETENKRLKTELAGIQERNEEMEFRLMELEQCGDNTDEKDKPCPETSSTSPAISISEVSPNPSPLPDNSNTWSEQPLAEGIDRNMEQFAKELAALLKDKGRDGEAALQKLDGFLDKEKSLESMAHELQMKVISLQQEKNSLQDRLLLVEQSRPGTGGSSAALIEAKERQENLALKGTLESQSLLVSEQSSLHYQLEDLKDQNAALQGHVEFLIQQQHQQEPVKESAQQTVLQSLQVPLTNQKANHSSKVSSLSRKPSDRKSKSRDGEEDPTISKRRKNASDDEFVRKCDSVGDIKLVDCGIPQNVNLNDDLGTMTDNQELNNAIHIKMSQLEQELTNIKCCNDDLIIQLQQSIAKKQELESSHHVLKDKITSMEQELDLLHKENVALGEQLRQRVEEFQFSQDELNPRVYELEEFIEDLQDRLREAENCERQLREKLKIFEKSIEEAETQEMMMREKCEQLLAGDNEAKKHIQALQRTELELRDIVLEKEIVEQALREKVDFLQKAEAASVQRIEELESIVDDLRQQLDEKSDGKGQLQKEAHMMKEMKHQMSFLETDNKALSARVAELEENEEILRENWRRVADEDFNRTQCLEEKVKMLEGVNRDLKVKLKDAQEYLVIDMSKSNLSLAAELAESESKIFEDSSGEEDNDMAGTDEVDSPSKQNDGMRERVRKLERQLSEVAEQKNTKIESLQEQLVHLKETEIKLSETISEMEMTERELRAKLALYESSEVTVEKMLKYQSKIEELRTSQESLLDQLEIKENQEMTLQEKMQEMERTLRGTIVTLEVEMKGYKQKELKNAGRIRELEKQENELSEKVTQQAEKENSLYIKISSLMDDLKARTTELENVRKQMEEKEDKVRQAKLLEVKLLEIEMECGKKVSSLDAKLRHREEEFRHKQAAFEEQMAELQTSQEARTRFEYEVSQKDKNMQEAIVEKETMISKLSSEISELLSASSEFSTKVQSLENELSRERQTVSEKEKLMQHLQDEIASKVNHLESVVSEKETEYMKEKQSFETEIHLKEKKVSELERELQESLEYMRELEIKKIDQKAAETEVSKLQSFFDHYITDVEEKVTSKLSGLENKLKHVNSHISDLQLYVSEKCIRLHELESENDQQRQMFDEEIIKIEKQKLASEDEMKDKLHSLNSQLKEEMYVKEKEQSVLLKESQEREASLRFDVSNLQHQVKQHKHELIAKLSELEAKNKAHCELSLEVSNIRREHKSLQKDLNKSKLLYNEIKSTLESKEDEMTELQDNIMQLNENTERLESDLYKKNQTIEQITTEKENVIKEMHDERQRLTKENSLAEKQISEQCQEIGKVNELYQQSQKELAEVKQALEDKDLIIESHEQEKEEKELILKESQSQIQSAEVSRNSLSQEVQCARSRLEVAQSQVAHQQQELQALQNQLKNNQQEIETAKMTIKQKEDHIQNKDQIYDEISSEMKKLNLLLQERDQELKQAQSQASDVGQKLQKAENRVRELESLHVSLEMRLEERYTVSHEAEKVLLSKEMHCKDLENKLDVSEKNLRNLKDQINVGEENRKELTERLQAKEMEMESLETKCKQLEVDSEHWRMKCTEEKGRVEEITSQQEVLISSLENNLLESESHVTKLTTENGAIKEELKETEKNRKDCESQITMLKDDNLNLKTKCDDLNSQLDHVSHQLNKITMDHDDLFQQAKEKDLELYRNKDEISKNSQELAEHVLKFKEKEKMFVVREVELETLKTEHQSLKQIIEKLTSEKDCVQIKQEQLHQEIQFNEERNRNQISKFESEKSHLESVMESLQKENIDLKEKNQRSESDVNTIKQECNELRKKEQHLSEKSSEADNKMDNLLTTIKALESDLSVLTKERNQALQEFKQLETENHHFENDNIQLQKEIEEATKEFQSLAQSFEESKTEIENRVQEISQGKQKVEKDLSVLQKQHNSKISEMFEELEGKDKEIDELKHRCHHIEEENLSLTAGVESLKLELRQAQDKNSGYVDDIVVFEEMVSETNKQVSSALPSKSTPSSKEVKKVNSDDDDNTFVKNDQRMTHLEALVNEMKDREKQLLKRLSDLEIIEKELREQIVDIEMTVIVPLETENQDLKDEIGMVKQERDEVISKISKWDDDVDHEGAVQESETLHQRLEDALIWCEEMEKKNDILLEDIQKLETENENLHAKVADFEGFESESKDEILGLMEEIKRLQEVHRDTSVLEETETTLMDKVLDLEERERLLIQELETMKQTSPGSAKDGGEIDTASEKMKYLEQKNQILEDAEGKYMDKIMELEEDKHRLLSELSSLSNNVNPQKLQSHYIPHPSVNKDSVSKSTQTSEPFDGITVKGATDTPIVETSSSLSYSTPIPGQNDHALKMSPLEEQLQESQSKLEELDAKLREKETVVLYLQDKLELLKDSEGKLMDKLLEAEERASNLVHTEYSSQIAELNKKIEQIHEENEFLAENVEQYKKLFKEEKETCNDLQHRLLEDQSNVSELQKTQEELIKTQQMVEEIQSEYEEQLLENTERENNLKEKLSQMAKKQSDLEEILVTKTRREEQLQQQIDNLKSTENELRSRLTTAQKEEEDSALSDSGLSADDRHGRNDHIAVKEVEAVEAPIVHRSIKTVLLSRPPASVRATPSPEKEDPKPKPLPRWKKKLRQQSIENISHEELVFLVEDLQDREAALKRRVAELQAIDISDSSQKFIALESEKDLLEKRLWYVEQQNALSSDSTSDSYKPTPLGLSADVENKGRTGSSRSFTSATMLEKPEDVLHQRIKELEGLDKHNKTMVSELERDREVLHEIARKDKAMIHDLNVKIRELQLSERSLKEQVTNLEVSESSLFTKCEDLEAVRVQLEDRVHELEIHERRLRELVRKLKLDEERWLSKSDGMENAVAELSANEAQLKRLVQDIEIEKGGLSEKAEYLESRIRELESVEVTLLARIKDYENKEVTLQNRLVQLENAEVAAHSRASELDMLNVNLTQKHKKIVDENAIMTQHLAQLQGQVQDLDRRLLSSRDSEIAYKQHVESLQKNESLLQKKVREYELREIDSQSAIRELEQTAEINNDKLSALQRSENRLRYRVQELEGVGGQIPGELTPSQQQKVPQKMEDCQKQLVLLQAQVENLKLQLRQALQTTQQQSANKTDSDNDEERKTKKVSIAMEEYSQLHAKALMLDEYAYQNGELESSQEQLRDTILQLRQGKGACGHEVEIEVYRRRVESLQTCINKLKSSLSLGLTTSLLDPDQESGPQGDTLPARHLQVLESERVLQSVRGLHDNGKADTPTDSNGGVYSTGLTQVEDSMIQAEAVQNMASLPLSTMPLETKGGLSVEQPFNLEETHWKAIEARKPVTNSAANDSRGGVNAAHGREATPVSSSLSHHGKQKSSTMEVEEVTLHLQSESELSSYHRTTQNDTDSSSSPIPPPRKNRANRLSKNMSDDNSSNYGSGSEKDSHQNPAFKVTANQKHFVNAESLPLTASNIEKQLNSQQQQTRMPLSRFAEDSFYLPSSTQEGVDSLDDDESPPPLPANGPPGQETIAISGQWSRASSTAMQDNRRESLDNSTSGLSIRERIALIEKHLQSDAHTGSHSNKEEGDQLFYWKQKSTESLRQAESLDKNNKFLKEDINRLEKELEEKRRYINTLELWLSSTEDLLKNKSKQTDREMVEQLQLDLQKLRRELSQSGYNSDDAILDPAALKTELEHRDKEISSKRTEIETLAQELRRCHKECRSIEGMRRNALDSLRTLEKEVLYLQNVEDKLKKAQTEINSLKVQYDELDQFKNQALAMVQPLQMKVDNLTKKCREKDVLLRRLGAELRRGLHRPSSALDELTRLERAMNGEEYNTDNSDSLSDDLSPRVTHTKLRGRSVSMDELSFNSNTNSLYMPPITDHTLPKRQRPTPYVNARPRSAEAGSFGLRSPRGVQTSPQSSQMGQRPRGYFPQRGFDLAHKHFVAIADYDPSLYSQSGKPRLELTLREGDHVKVTGPMDRLGYCEAQCNGRTGLVPANYLQQVHQPDAPNHHPTSTGGSRIPMSSVFHPDLATEPSMAFQDHARLNGSSPRLVMTPGQRLYTDEGLRGVPDPPYNLHVRGMQEGCLVLAWKPPHMDAHGCNKGLPVIGYVVYVNNQEYQQISDPRYCQAVVEEVDPSCTHYLAVQTLCAGGQLSARAELVFEGTFKLDEWLPEQGDDGHEPLDTDLSSVLNSVHYTKGVKKKVMALYQYNPEQQSPHDYTAFELAFQAGDVIAVYGEPRPDGFYHGEIEGRRGLVPACFVEDLSTALRHGKQGSEDSGHESSKA